MNVVKRIAVMLSVAFVVSASVWAGRQMLQWGQMVEAATITNPIMFVTQIPDSNDFTTIVSTFGNHLGTMRAVRRGGDLHIRYPDGATANLTRLAGYGSAVEFQGADAIAVRDPSVHWDGDKAIFSMLIGAPAQQYQYNDYYWQLYEITNFTQQDIIDATGPIITKVPNQPEDYNNINPIYATDDQIIFVTDRPHNGERHLYPQLDEYESSDTPTGLWKLDPTTGDLLLLNHAPSGDFTPMIDSFGRVIFTQWDHLQTDQQAYADSQTPPTQTLPYGSFNYSDESADAIPDFDDRTELFPEPRFNAPGDPSGFVDHSFNHFFAWQITEDGLESEVLNHLGRHELHRYFTGNITDDVNVQEFIYFDGIRYNENDIQNMFHVEEDPLNPGVYYGVDAPEFQTHASGMIFSLEASPTSNADAISVTYVTHPDTRGGIDTPDHSGHYREPVPLSDGTLIAVHTPETGVEANDDPSIYDFRLKELAVAGNGYWEASVPLTDGYTRTISYWSPDFWVTMTVELWELNPVEVVARTRPTPAEPPALSAPEQQIFDNLGITVAEMEAYLEQNDLALLISRDVTTRDDADRQQPFNLRIPGGVQTVGAGGTIYDVAYLQYFQGDQVRGYLWGGATPQEGRRVIPQPMHDANAMVANPPSPGPDGSVVLGLDGSMAAFVPTQRALSWQLTAPDGEPVVRERYWLTFQPGEIRTCTSCHGLNVDDQAGGTTPTNPPQALHDLLVYWQSTAPTAVETSEVVATDSDQWGVIAVGLFGLMGLLLWQLRRES